MKVVILAGGYGTRISEESQYKPKPMVEIGGQQSTLSNFGEGIPKPMIEVGGKPLLWHIMKHFSEYGYSEFVICGGYRVDMIKDYFLDLREHRCCPVIISLPVHLVVMCLFTTLREL